MEKNNLHKRVLNGTLIILFVSVLAKFTSFISESILAAYLGTSEISDAYYMVSSVQNVIYPMISVGIWKVFFPLYKAKQTKNDLEGANALANKSLTLFTMISLVVCVLLAVFSKQVVSLIAPGFSDANKELCAELVRISSPMYIFIVAAAIFATMLQSHDRFFGSQIREVVSHIPTIIAAVFFYKRFGIEAMAYALILCGVIRLLVELPFVNWGYKYKPDFRFKSPELSLLFRRIPSALLSTGVGRINTIIDKMMASGLAAGTISALNYGAKLKNVFGGLVSDALATATYPQMLELITNDKKDQLNKLVVRVLSIFATFIFPATLACILFSRELITVVYARGAFDAHSVDLTALIFAFYCICLMSSASNVVLNNLFYGYGDTKKPLLFSIVNLLLNIVFNFVFIHYLGAAGLALATSVSSVICCILRMIWVRQYVVLDYKSLLRMFGKLLIAAAIACFIPWFVVNGLFENAYLKLAVAAVVGVVLYLVMLRIFRIDTLNEVVGMIKDKFTRKKEGRA